jgi:hypothetical protein
MSYKRILTIVSFFFLSACSGAIGNAPTRISITTPTITPIILVTTSSDTPEPTNTPNSQPSTTSTPPLPQRSKFDNISGTYKVTNSDGGECVIKVAFEQIDPIKKINFEVFCIRGAPSYDAGWTNAQLLYGHDMAVYAPSPDCNIVLQFHDNQIDVTQIGLDYKCGFGATVYTDGIYKLIDDKPPVIGCMNEINSCNLEEPIP